MPAEKSLELPDNHRRAVATALALLDEMLCRFERWARGEASKGVMYRERNALDRRRRTRLLRRIAALREEVSAVKEDLHLEARERDVGSAVWAESAAFWENLVELGPRYLRRYGELPAESARYLERKVALLVRHLDALGRGMEGDDGKPAESERPE